MSGERWRLRVSCFFLFFVPNKRQAYTHKIKKQNKQRIVKFINPLASFISKVDIKNHPSPKKIDDIEMNKKIFCKNCGEDWGVTALISGVEWMCIKICSFILEFPGKDQPRRMYKKWKDLPFGIKEASVEEILKQSGDKGPGDDLLDFNFNIWMNIKYNEITMWFNSKEESKKFLLLSVKRNTG